MMMGGMPYLSLDDMLSSKIIVIILSQVSGGKVRKHFRIQIGRDQDAEFAKGRNRQTELVKRVTRNEIYGQKSDRESD
jgi:hypothetical protein